MQSSSGGCNPTTWETWLDTALQRLQAARQSRTTARARRTRLVNQLESLGDDAPHATELRAQLNETERVLADVGAQARSELNLTRAYVQSAVAQGSPFVRA